MKKRIAAMFMAVLVTVSFQGGVCLKDGGVYAEEKKEISIVIDGTKLPFSKEDGLGVPFIDHNGRTQVPVRKPLEKIGAAVSFKTDGVADENGVIISKDGKVIRLAAGDPFMRVNQDTFYLLDAPPQIIESRAYLPIRAVFEVLGYSVAWDGASRTVSIQKNQNLPVPPGFTPVGQFKIPQYQGKEGERPEIIINHGYIYYLGENNDIMQTTFSDLTKSKKIFHCPEGSIYLFNDENGVPRLYSQAYMGKPHQWILNTDGSMTELRDGGESPAGLYSTGGSFDGRQAVYLIDDELYLLATPLAGDAGRAVYRVNIKTGESVRITDGAYGIQIEGKYLYYVIGTGKEIRKRNLEDGTETTLYDFYGSATNSASDFAVLNGHLYLMDRNRLFIANVGEENESSVAEGGYITFCNDMALRGDGGEQYLVCMIGKTSVNGDGSGSWWLWVYDKDGKRIMEREGDITVNSVSIEDGKICYYNKTTNQINVERLNEKGDTHEKQAV